MIRRRAEHLRSDKLTKMGDEMFRPVVRRHFKADLVQANTKLSVPDTRHEQNLRGQSTSEVVFDQTASVTSQLADGKLLVIRQEPSTSSQLSSDRDLYLIAETESLQPTSFSQATSSANTTDDTANTFQPVLPAQIIADNQSELLHFAKFRKTCTICGILSTALSISSLSIDYSWPQGNDNFFSVIVCTHVILVIIEIPFGFKSFDLRRIDFQRESWSTRIQDTSVYDSYFPFLVCTLFESLALILMTINLLSTLKVAPGDYFKGNFCLELVYIS